MRQVFLDKGSVVVKQVSQPMLQDTSVLVSVSYSYISSGTEIATLSTARSTLINNVPQKIKKVIESVKEHGIEGTATLIKNKLKGGISSLGYSCSGHVVAVGKKVTKYRPGDLVACAGAGYAHHADLVCVPELLVSRISHEKFLKAASLTTIGTIALQGVRRAQLQIGDRICVYGLGLLGQITIQLAKLSGCSVIGIDIIPERLNLAKQMGAMAVLHGAHDNIKNEIDLLTQHYGVDTTIITAASNTNTIMQTAMEITRKKGRVVIVGNVGLGLEREPLYQKEIDVCISCSYGPGRYDTSYEQEGIDYPYAYVRWTENRNMAAFIELIETEKLSTEIFIQNEIPLEQAAEAYQMLEQKKSLGVLLACKPAHCTVMQPEISQQATRFTPAVKDNVRVGILGAGGFAKIKLMPIIAKMRNVTINAIADTQSAIAENVAQVYQCAQIYASDEQLLESDTIDVVVIASPHRFHAPQAIGALQKGKAVFLEKPMLTDFSQLELFKLFSQKMENMPLCVDYNRSFSPFIQKIKKIINKRQTPLMVHYRMNAGYISKEHWVQTETGAGRIIGEACHIIDLFCFLTDAKPIAVSVDALYTSREDLFPTDNFSCQISFQDGSVCSLLYTALGHKELGKERMELFFDKKAIIMEDFLTLFGFGLPSNFNETVKTANKGRESLLTIFFNALKEKQFVAPIPINRLLQVSELTLIIDQLACRGGGSKQLE